MNEKMIEGVLKHLNSICNIPDEEWGKVVNSFYVKKIAKNDYFARCGETATEIGFVFSGVLRIFLQFENGQEFTRDFKTSGTLVASYSSLIRGTPSVIEIQACSDTTLVVLPYKVLQELYQKHICWQELGRIIAEQKFLEMEQREIELATLDLVQKYDIFRRRFPEVLDVVPQRVIASYLGVSPVSLSRVVSRATRRV